MFIYFYFVKIYNSNMYRNTGHQNSCDIAFPYGLDMLLLKSDYLEHVHDESCALIFVVIGKLVFSCLSCSALGAHCAH